MKCQRHPLIALAPQNLSPQATLSRFPSHKQNGSMPWTPNAEPESLKNAPLAIMPIMAAQTEQGQTSGMLLARQQEHMQDSSIQVHWQDQALLGHMKSLINS